MMKNALFLFCLTILGVVLFAACDKMDSTYRGFIVKDGVTYPGKATSPMVAPGRNRVRINWLRGTDPSVTHATIFWNNYADSLAVMIPASGDTVTALIGNLPEKSYSFEIVTYDEDGNPSVPVELLALVYGGQYEANLLNRPVVSSLTDVSGDVTVVWGSVDVSNGAFATDVTYVDTLGDSVTQRIAAESDTSWLTGYAAGTSFRFRTAFLPDSASIDTFYTTYEQHAAYRAVSRAGWVASADSYTSPYVPGNVIDGNPNSFWNSEYKTNPPPFPHWWQADMGNTYPVSIVELTCRQDYLLGFDFTIQGSMDGVNWTNYDTYTLLPQKASQRFMVTGAPVMRFIRIYQTNPSLIVVPSCFAELTVYQ